MAGRNIEPMSAREMCDRLLSTVEQLVTKQAFLEAQLNTTRQDMAMMKHEERKYVPIKHSRDPKWTVTQEIELVFLQMDMLVAEMLAGVVAEYAATKRPLNIVIGEEYDILAYSDTRWIRARAIAHNGATLIRFNWWDNKVWTSVYLSASSSRLEPLGVMTGVATD